jgi:hypothetical protein
MSPVPQWCILLVDSVKRSCARSESSGLLSSQAMLGILKLTFAGGCSVCCVFDDPGGHAGLWVKKLGRK